MVVELRVPKNQTLVHIETPNQAPTTIVVEENAQLHHVRLLANAQNLPTVTVQVAANAQYKFDFLLADAANAVQSMVVHLNAPNASAHIHGVQLGSATVTAGSNFLVKHMAPQCSSRQFVRNVLNDSSKLEFVGKVFVDQVAQKTDGYQLCNSILLSEKAEIKTRPELEIYADDVKCSHGNTVGCLDLMALFYLKQRGLSAAEAKKMLLGSFVAEVFDNEQAEEHLLPACMAWLDKHVA